MHIVDLKKAAVYEELDVRKLLLQGEDPVVLQRRNVPVLFRIESFEERLSGVDNELLDASFLRHSPDEVHDVFPSVQIIYSESAFDSDRDVDALNSPLADGGHKIRLIHEFGSEAAVDSLVGRTATVEVDLVIAVLLDGLGSSCYFVWIVSSNLSDNRMLVVSELEKLGIASLWDVDDGMFVQHFSIQVAFLSQQSAKVPKVVVRDVHHRRN